MKIESVHIIYFSSTGTTRKIIEYIGKRISAPVQYYDLTLPQENLKRIFSEKDLVIMAYPVYSGRIPELFRERIQNLQGQNTLLSVVATYGNRNYDDAALEMQDISKQKGFHMVNALLAVTEHSVVPEIGKGRPDLNDMQTITEFADRLTALLEEDIHQAWGRVLHVPGKHPYHKYTHVPVKAYSTDRCNGCGACIKLCPAGAITFDGTCHTNRKKCFGCMRCVRSCPQKARTIGTKMERAASWYMKRVCKEEKQSQILE